MQTYFILNVSYVWQTSSQINNINSKNSTISLIFSIIIWILVIGCFFLIRIIRNHKRKVKQNQIIRTKNIVEEKSMRVCFLKSLKQKYNFYNIEDKYIITPPEFKSKWQYENFIESDYKYFMYNYAFENKDKIIDVIKNVSENLNKFKSYQQELKNIPPIATEAIAQENGIYYNLFLKYEAELEQKYKITEMEMPEFLLIPRYQYHYGYYNRYSKHYHKVYRFNIFQMNYLINHYNTYQQERYGRFIERNKMTRSLRYDIMQRDKFKCVLCGRSSKNDNVKLHIDHIKPISKGGKTEWNNLRTLCEDCNLGKSNKYYNNRQN